jgi:hypothetical protein
MARDLAEFGFQNAVINTAKVSFAAMRISEVEPGKATIYINIVCDGAFLPFEFDESKRAEAEAMFQFFKSCVEKNAEP